MTDLKSVPRAPLDELLKEEPDPTAVVAAVIDVLAKHCRGSNYEATTPANVAQLVDRICEISAGDVQRLQAAWVRIKELEAALALPQTEGHDK